jgi:hypothetical protein
MKLRQRKVAIAIAIASSTGLLIAGGDAGSHYVPRIDLASFTTDVDNLPLRPGVVDEGPTVKRIVAEVTGDGRTVMGVPCGVVSDTATVAGKVVEVDWCLRPLVETFDLEHGPEGIEPGP